MRIFKDLDK